MKKNSGGFDWFLLILLLVVFIVLVIASAATNSDTVKNYRNDVKNKADELRKDILNQEGIVNRIRTELNILLSQQDYLKKKAKKICIAIKCTGVVIIVGSVIMMHAIFSLNPIEFTITLFTVMGIVYGTFTGVVLNEVRGINDTLRLLQDVITQRTFDWHNFQPAVMETLKLRLQGEEDKLNSLRMKYNAIKNSQNNIN